MSDPIPQPLLELQAVLGAAESAFQRIVAEVATARERAQSCLPAEDFEDYSTERPGIAGWALSLDGSAEHVLTTLCGNALVELDRARRSSPAEPSPEPWPWVGEQALAAARVGPAGFESEGGAPGPGSSGVEVAG